MTADGSMAVWSEHKAGADGATAEIHFNYWRIAGDDAFCRKNPEARDFIEIGILIRGALKVEQAKIYLPGCAATWQIEDCGVRFRNAEIAQGIFNKELSVPQELSSQHSLSPEHYDLVLPDGKPFCRVHVFLTENEAPAANQLVKEELGQGTLLTIMPLAFNEVCRKLQDEIPAYFRIRAYVQSGQISPFVKRITPKDWPFQTGYSVVDYLDFRLNEARSLPRNVETLMRQGAGKRVPHTLVAFLTAVPIQSDVTAISWEQAHKRRLLEDQLWSAYVPSGLPSGMTVYHWREAADDKNPSIEDFVGFVKMQTRLASWRIVLTSLAIAFLAGVAGNLLASCIWEAAHSTPPDRRNPPNPGVVQEPARPNVPGQSLPSPSPTEQTR